MTSIFIWLLSCFKITVQSGRASLGDSIYRYVHTADKFSPDNLLDFLNISSEHEALELADRVEASMYTWRRKACLSHSKSSWNKVKDLMSDTDRSDKNYILAERAETLLFCLKQRYPELSQTSLDTFKIQYNRVSFRIIYSWTALKNCRNQKFMTWLLSIKTLFSSSENGLTINLLFYSFFFVCFGKINQLILILYPNF